MPSGPGSLLASAKVPDSSTPTITERRQKIIDLFIDGGFSKEAYEEQVQKLDLKIANLEVLTQDVLPTRKTFEGLLDFAEWFLGNSAAIWVGAESEKKRRIQGSLFPAGLTVSKDGFRTPRTASFLNSLEEANGDELSLASPGGFEPPLPP